VALHGGDRDRRHLRPDRETTLELLDGILEMAHGTCGQGEDRRLARRTLRGQHGSVQARRERRSFSADHHNPHCRGQPRANLGQR